MTWVKLTDDFYENPKMACVSNDAIAVFVVGLAYCNRNLTDGFIPTQVALTLRYCDGNAVPTLRELEEAGLWEPCAGGYQVHDYHDFQPSKAAVLDERRLAKERQSRHRSRQKSRRDSGVTNGSVTPPPVPVPVPVPELPSIEDELKGNALDVGEFVEQLNDSDEQTPTILRALSRDLPEAAFRTALESLEIRRGREPHLVSETRYFVAALTSMKRERQYA